MGMRGSLGVDPEETLSQYPVGTLGGMTYLLRVVMPDRPGMLGAIATALGDAGADIVSLDVVERGPDGAVDDLLVQLPPGGLADVLITSAQKVPGVDRRVGAALPRCRRPAPRPRAGR